MADAHSQISGCPGFAGVNAQAREIAAGYPRALAYTEVALTYGNNPRLAIPGWMVHALPPHPPGRPLDHRHGLGWRSGLPPPASGWPSSFPVSIYAQRLNITEHVMTKDGDGTPLEHIFLDTKNSGVAQLRAYFGNTAMLYGAAFEPSTTYRVKMVGTYAGGALNMEWTFTTSARRPTRF
jgi:hypothetical protein